MLLHVLRLLAVYTATAVLLLALAHRFVRPLCRRVALFLTLAPMLLSGKALLTAGVQAPLGITYEAPPLSAYRAEMRLGRTQTPILSDVVASYIPWRKAVREAVRNKRIPLWNRFQLCGDPLLAVQEPAVFHPATWIGFLLPLGQSWSFEMALHSLLALLAAYLFFREFNCGEWISCLGAAAWAFSDYLVFFLGFPISPATAPFPLLLLALRRLVHQREPHGAAILVSALLLITTSGHPETLLHSVAGGGVYFLVELGLAGRGRRLRTVLRSLGAGALAAGLSAVVILPFAEVLPHTREHELRKVWFAKIDPSVPLRENLRLFVVNAMPYAFGVSGQGKLSTGYEEPGSYAGSLIFPFTLLGLFSRRREKWAFLLLAFLGLSLWTRVDVISDAVQALPLFDIALNQRLVFLATFALIALAVFGVEQIQQRQGTAIFLTGTVVSIAALTAVYLHSRPRLLALEMPSDYLLGRFLVQVLPLAAAAIAVVLWQGSRTTILALVLLLLLAQRELEVGGVYKTHRFRVFFPHLDLLDKIPRKEPYRVAPLDYTFLPNIATLYELEDVRGYASMTHARLAQTFPLWCEADPIWWNRVADPTRPFLSYLNVRYFIGPPGHSVPPGWKLLAETKAGVLFENPNVLPRVFVPRYLFYEKNPWSQIQMVKSNPDFAKYGIVDAPPPAGGPSFSANGEAQVRIDSYTGQRMILQIDAKADTILATSLTRWPGWKLALHDREISPIPYNWAFWGFRVPRGHHEAVLYYLPDGFIWGLSITAVTAVVSAVLLLTAAGKQSYLREVPLNAQQSDETAEVPVPYRSGQTL